VVDYIEDTLPKIQADLYTKALQFRDQNITPVDDYSAFKKVIEDKGGFVSAHWDGTSETEEAIKKETKATIRCIPLHGEKEAGTCVYSGKPSAQRVLFAKAY